MTDVQQQIADRLRYLEGDRVKALVLNWLAETNASLLAFERLVEAETDDLDDQPLTYGEFDNGLGFQPLAEADMIKKSLEALEQYQCTGNAISHENVREWVDSLGTDHEFPCPQ